MPEIVIGRSERDLKKYGTEGTVFIGKQYVKMGDTMSLANKVLLDVIRPHIILVTGKRGEGKCLHGDTPIVLANGEVKTIKELAEDKNDILSLDYNLKLKTANKTKFYLREVNELIEIELKTGKTIKLTPEHPLLTVKGWENACNLKEGSRIATPRKINVFGSENMSDSEIKLLAYLIAEGHLKEEVILFSNTDEKITKEFKQEIKNFGENFVKEIKFDSKSPIRRWLDSLNLYEKEFLKKEIPNVLFKLPKYKLALFLNRLFSSKGEIYPRANEWEISYSSSSKKLITQIQHLLLRFGIISNVKLKVANNDLSYKLIIQAQNAIKFLQEIGFFGSKELKAAMALKELKSKIRNPNVDTIPKELWSWYKPKNWENSVGIGYSPSREKLLQIARIDNNESAIKLAESDIYWDEIVRIKRLCGKFMVYDISVPKYHNFIAGDIIVHNSYTMSQIAESVISFLPKEISQNISMLFLDTMGIFWTMKFPNYRDEALLHKWGLEPKGLKNVKLFVPGGKFDELKEKGIPVDEKFYLTTSDLEPLEWCLTLGIKPTDPTGVLITRVITELKKSEELFDINDIIKKINEDKKIDEKIKTAAASRFEAIKSWGLFAKEGTKLDKIIQGGVASILDISVYTHVYGAFSIRSLVIALFAKKILEEREMASKMEEKEEIEGGLSYFRERKIKKKKTPMVWIFIDEVHEFLPQKGKTLATGPLLQLIREGRQPGISLVVATQQPGKMNTDVLSQCDIVISHRVTSKMDINALNTIMQTFMTQTLSQSLNQLPRVKGCALILDQNQERLYSVQMRPRFSWHGGETPTAIPPKAKKI